MNEQTEQLIRELAEKLGVTAEHLWGVMIRQAWISGVTNLILFIVWITILAIVLRLLLLKTIPPPETKDDKYPHAEWEGEAVFIMWAAWAILAAFTLIGVMFGMEEFVASFLNPEFWALKQLIGK